MPPSPDFDLIIVAAGDGYTVRVQAAYGVRELPPQAFALPLDLAALPARRRDAAQWVKQTRITMLKGSPELRAAREFGGGLFRALFSGEVLAALRASRAALSAGERLRLRLRLPPALASLPWELLYDARDEQFLALAPDLSLLRYPAVPLAVAPLAVSGPLQALVVCASPRSDDYPPINVERELRRLDNALKLPIAARQLAREVIRGPGTLDQLRARLRRPVHLLHILCHGDLDETGGEGVLIFEDADGGPEPVNAELLRQQLQKQRGQTRLVLINACLGALPVGEDPFSSVGAALSRGGVPAVIAMQFEIAEDAAAELARVFYAELAAGAPVDLALTEARLHLYGRFPARLDWAIPVLFLRGDDGALFVETGRPGDRETGRPETEDASPAVLTPSPGDPSPPAPVVDLDRLWRQALAAYLMKQWARAAELLAQVAARDGAYKDVQARLAAARRQLELQRFYAELCVLRDDDQWPAVLGGLAELEQRQSGYPDPQGLRAWAEGRQRREQRYDAALAAADQGAWPAAIAALEELLAEAPDDGEAQALLAHARAEQTAAEAEQQRRAEEERLQREAAARQAAAEQERRRRAEAEQRWRARFAPIQEQLKAGAFTQAIDLLAQLLGQEPGDREAASLAARLVETPQAPFAERLRAAGLAGTVGDPRCPVALAGWRHELERRPTGFGGPAWAGATPPPYWRAIPAGAYRIGGWEKDQPAATITLPAFWIARFPITVAQYAPFVQAGYGKDAERWWTKEGWQWKRTDPETTQPYFWNDESYNGPNQPVIGITWYEATAFCSWLTAQLDDALPQGYVVRLPTEAEWEAAAAYDGAGQRRNYPWGAEEPNPERAIYGEDYGRNPGRPAPVGCCPAGAAACGALDMAGNVWEMTASSYNSYPAGSNALVKDFTPGEFDVPWRGGFRWSDRTYVRCGARDWNRPDVANVDLVGGVRVCLAPRLAQMY